MKNQFKAYENISEIVDNRDLSKSPIMMFRPRALNMIDHSIKVNGQPLNGGLMDFAIIMFENAQKIIEKSPSFEERQVPRLDKGCSLKKWTRPEIGFY